MKSEWVLFLVVAVCLSAATLVASSAPADEPDDPGRVVDCNHPRGGNFVGDCAGHCNDLTQCNQCCNRAYPKDTTKKMRAWLKACYSRCSSVWPKQQEADLEGEPPQIQPESDEIESA